MVLAKRNLYLCSQLLNLYNSIVLQSTAEAGTAADLVLADTSDFSQIQERLAAHGLFENIYQFNVLGRLNQIKAEGREALQAAGEDPLGSFMLPELTHTYTDLYVHLDSYAAKFFYYALVKQGMHLQVHFVNEGSASYAMDFSNTVSDAILHEQYGEDAFLNRIGNLWVYEPELYVGGVEKLVLKTLPKAATEDKALRALLRDVFGAARPIAQKVIYFEGTFAGDGMLVNEMDLVNAVAKAVGKENMIVKRHPRNPRDRFSPAGFQVMENQNVPWEIMLLDLDIADKLLVSVASFAGIAPMEMYGMAPYTLLLNKLLLGRVYFLESPGYKRFFDQAISIYNRDQTRIWRPESMIELETVLRWYRLKYLA